MSRGRRGGKKRAVIQRARPAAQNIEPLPATKDFDLSIARAVAARSASKPKPK